MISVGFKTDKGVSRTDNEDSVFVLPDRNLYMVADGVGGQTGPASAGHGGRNADQTGHEQGQCQQHGNQAFSEVHTESLIFFGDAG